MSKTSDAAYATGKGLARNLTVTPAALEALNRADADRRAALLREVRAALVGRVVK